MGRTSRPWCRRPDSDDTVITSTIHAALRQGALPSLTGVDADLEYATHRELLTEGFVGGMHELCFRVVYTHDLAPQLAALGLVRQLPALAKLELLSCSDGLTRPPVEWPPFIPPSLKALRIVADRHLSEDGPLDRDLLRALPGTLGASGARLEPLEVIIPTEFRISGDGLLHVAQALRRASPALRGFLLTTDAGLVSVDLEEHAERLRRHWAELLAGVSACRELEVLVLPPCIEVEPLFPPGTAFARLRQLQICDLYA
jgi:hypothetical protein